MFQGLQMYWDDHFNSFQNIKTVIVVVKIKKKQTTNQLILGCKIELLFLILVKQDIQYF